MNPYRQRDLRSLQKQYKVPLERWGKFINIVEKGRDLALVLQVKNQYFEINRRVKNTQEHRDYLEWMKIMVCQAMNVAYMLEMEGVDTSDDPETDFTNAVVGKFHRPGQLIQISDVIKNELGVLAVDEKRGKT
jgi:hypothetical protein